MYVPDLSYGLCARFQRSTNGDTVGTPKRYGGSGRHAHPTNLDGSPEGLFPARPQALAARATDAMVTRLARRMCTNAKTPLHRMLASTPQAHARSVQVLLKSQFRNVFDPVTTASQNFENILGVDTDAVISLHAISFLCGYCHPRTPYQRDFKLDRDVKIRIGAWQNVHRGKQIFIKGLGHFDIGLTYSEVLASRWQISRLHQMKDLLRILRPTDLCDLWPDSSFGPARSRWLVEQGIADLSALAQAALFEPDCIAEMAQRVPQWQAVPQWLTSGAERAVSLSRLSPQLDRTLLTTPASVFVGGCLLVPIDLCAWAYFSQARAHDQQRNIVQILALEESSPVRQHLLRFKDYWNDAQHANALDELLDGGAAPLDVWPEGGELMEPRTLLKRLQQARRVRALGANRHYAHLDALEDGPVGADGLQLRVLRSWYSIAAVAETMRNCAASYDRRVAEGNYALVALFDTTTDQPLALAGFAAKHFGNFAVHPQWDHRPVLSRNRTAPKEMHERFDAFLAERLTSFDPRRTFVGRLIDAHHSGTPFQLLLRQGARAA